MAILILMMEAGNPENWHWLWGGRPPVGGDGQLEEDQIAGREIDSRLRLKSPNNSQALLGIASDSLPASPSVDPAQAELDGEPEEPVLSVVSANLGALLPVMCLSRK